MDFIKRIVSLTLGRPIDRMCEPENPFQYFHLRPVFQRRGA